MGVPVLLFPFLQKGPPAGQIANFFTIILKIAPMTSTFPELSTGISHGYVHWSTLQSLKVVVLVSEECILGGKARKNRDMASSMLIDQAIPLTTSQASDLQSKEPTQQA